MIGYIEVLIKAVLTVFEKINSIHISNNNVDIELFWLYNNYCQNLLCFNGIFIVHYIIESKGDEVWLYGLWCLTPLSIIFRLYQGSQFY